MYQKRFSLPVMILGAGMCLLTTRDTAAQTNRTKVRIPAGAPLKTLGATPQEPSFTDTITSTLKKGLDGLTAPLRSTPGPPNSVHDPTSLQSGAKPSVRLHVEVGRLAEQTGKFDEAERHYRRALELNPDDLHALLSYARLNDRRHKLDEAFRLYQRAARAHPKAAPTFNYLGLHYDRRGMSRQAAAALTRAVQLNPTEQLYRNNLAHVLVELDRLPEAFRHLKAVHGEAIAYYNLGYLLNKLGRRRPAAKHLQLALQKDPTLDQAGSLLAGIQPTGAPRPQVGSRVADAGRRKRQSGSRMPDARPRTRTVDLQSSRQSSRQSSTGAPRSAQARRSHSNKPRKPQPSQAPSVPLQVRHPDRTPAAQPHSPQPPAARSPSPERTLRQPAGAVLPDSNTYPRTSPQRYPRFGPAPPPDPPVGGPDYVEPPVRRRSSAERERARLRHPAGIVGTGPDSPGFVAPRPQRRE